MTYNSTISKTCISCVTLRNENYKELAPLLEDFHSRDEAINHVISKRPSVFSNKGEKYDNRDTVYLYIFTDPETLTRRLLGYISCAASSLSAKLDDQKIVIPCVVINTFAISKDFTDKTGTRVSDGHSEYKCSLYVLYNFLELMDNYSYKLGITHVYLFAQQKRKVVDFYLNECKFTQISAGNRVFGEPDGAHEYTLLYSLKNGRYRFNNK